MPGLENSFEEKREPRISTFPGELDKVMHAWNLA